MRFALLLLLCLFAAATAAIGPAVSPAFAQDAAEIAFWESVRDSKNPAELQAYLDTYPNGAYAALAKIRIGSLGGTAAPAPEPAPAPQPQPTTDTTTTTTTAPKTGPQIAPDKASYPPFEQITLNWSGIPTSLTSGWVALYRQSDMQELTRASIDFSTKKAGSTTFDGMLPGTYEVRLLTPPYGSEYVLGKTSFVIVEPGTAEAGEGATLTAVNATVLPFEPIEMRWDRIPASMESGWVRMSKADGQEVTRVSIDSYTAKSGTVTFDGTLPGEYVFDLLSPPYGSELLLATVRLTIADPNAAQPAPAPAPEPTPAPAPDAGAADAGAADAGATEAGTGAATDGRDATGTREAAAAATTIARSTLGSIAFIDQPVAGDANLGPMLITALGPDLPTACSGPTESYRWTIAADEDARLQKVLNDSVVGLKASGYEVTQVPINVENALIYKGAGPDQLLMVWVLDEEDAFLGMVLCPTQ